MFVLPGPLLGTILRCGDTGDIYLVLIMERVELRSCVHWLKKPQNFETAVKLETESWWFHTPAPGLILVNDIRIFEKFFVHDKLGI